MRPQPPTHTSKSSHKLNPAPSQIKMSRFAGWWKDSLLLSGLVAVFCLHYYHGRFIFQGDHELQLLIHSIPHLYKHNWDPHMLGYLGWLPIVGKFFPLNMLMHVVTQNVFDGSPLAILIGVQINAYISLTLLAISIYFLLRFLERSRMGALIGACITSLAGFHVQTGVREFDLFYLHSFMFVGPALIFYLKALREKSILWAIVSGAMVGFSLLGGGNTPMFLFIPFFIFLPLVDDKAKILISWRHMLRNVVCFLLTAVTGLLVGAGMVLPSLKFMGLTNRAEYVTDGLLSGVSPFYTALIMLYREWWNPSGFFQHEWDFFLGLPVITLMLIGLLARTRAVGKRFMGLLIIIPFVILHINYLPGWIQKAFVALLSIQSIGYPYRFFMVFLLAAGFFSALGFDYLKDAVKRASSKDLLFVKLLAIVTLAYCFIGTSFYKFDYASEQKFALVAALILAACLAGVLIEAVMRRRFHKTHQILVLSIVFLFLFASRADVPVTKNYAKNFKKQPVQESLHNLFTRGKERFSPITEKETEPFRISTIIGKYFHENYWAPLAEVDVAFEPLFNPSQSLLMYKYVKGFIDPKNRKQYHIESPLIDLYNVKYLAINDYKGNKFKPSVVPGVYKNPHAFERFFITHGARIFENEDELYKILGLAPASDMRKKVYLLSKEEPTSLALFRNTSDDITDAIRIIEREPNRIELEVDMSSAGYLVASELWFPEWTAQVNGTAKQIFRAYGTFWGVQLTQGTHRVVFKFWDRYTFWGKWISLISLLAFLVFLIFFGIKRSST